MNHITEAHRIVVQISPASLAAQAHNTASIDMTQYERVMFVVQTGALGTAATVDFAVHGDTASGGSFTTAITGRAITQLVKASHDNSLAIVEVTQDDVVAQGFRFIRGVLTVGAAASIAGVIAIGRMKHYQSDNSDSDLAAVVQIVN